MREPSTSSRVDFSVTCSNYWQSLLRFGLPCVILYRGIDYGLFRMAAGNAGLRYPWRVDLIMDLPLLFLFTTIWWGLMRQIAGRKRKSEQG